MQWDKGLSYLLFLQHIQFFFLHKYFYSFSPNEHTHIYIFKYKPLIYIGSSTLKKAAQSTNYICLQREEAF